MYQVRFYPGDILLEAPEGISLLEAQIKAGLQPDAPCGGNGTCGKCMVELLAPDGSRQKVKACRTLVDRDMEVILPQSGGSHRILETGRTRNFALDPPVRAKTITVKKGSLLDPRSDWDRIKEAVSISFSLPEEEIRPNLKLASQADRLLKELDYTPQAVVYQRELLALRKPGRLCAAAVDIGTTTVVLYLLDCETGETLAAASMLNPQTEFGADVIMRANYALEKGVEPLRQAICKAVNQLLSKTLLEAGVAREDVFTITVVGNTCMHHLFLGISPQSLVLSPYHPAISEELVLDAADQGILIHPAGKLQLLPCIAGFVGADTSSVMLCCEMDTEKQLTLAIDIGTNGELVLGDRNRLVACSTAAGPAFEGAKITCGMRGADGAIDHLSLTEEGISFSTIGGKKPVGICGSGLMDLTAVLLDAGILDETGRILDEDEIDSPAGKALLPRLREIDGMKAFVLAFPEESGSGREIYLSQKDIREVQLAKGAMAAGIGLMLKALGKKEQEIQRVLIAGAFGNYMSPKSACRIGLIPPALEDRILPIGNAAGEGARIAALNHQEFLRAQTMMKKTGFIELASDPDFQDRFVDELMFPEGD